MSTVNEFLGEAFEFDVPMTMKTSLENKNLPKQLLACIKDDDEVKFEHWFTENYEVLADFEERCLEKAWILYKCVDNGALDCTKFLLGKNIPPDLYKDQIGRTALLVAARSNQPDTLRLLLDSGANANHLDMKRISAVVLSARYGHDSCVEVLLKSGANPNGHSQFYDHTALTEAVSSDHLKSAQLLLEAGASIDEHKSEGETSLMIAAENGFLPCVEELLKHGPDLSLVSQCRKTALSYAIYGNHHEIVKCLIQQEGIDLERTDNMGFTALAAALCEGNAETVELLLDAGASLGNIRDLASVAKQCAGNGGELCLQLLMGYSNDLKLKNTIRDTLMEAVSGDHLDCVKLLVNHGADLEFSTSNLVQEAATHGSKQCLKFLLNAKMDVNIRNKRGQTPLHEAATHGEPDCVNILLAHGADISAKDNDGKTAGFMAFSPDVFAVLIREGMDIHAQDGRGQTLLMYVCDETVVDCDVVLRLLLSAGAHIDAVDHRGCSAVMFAAKTGTWNCFKTLMEKGANLGLCDHDGFTVLEHTLQLSSENNPFLFKASKKNLKVLLETLSPSLELEKMIKKGLTYLFLDTNRASNEGIVKDFAKIFFKFIHKFPCILSWCNEKLARIAEVGNKDTIRFLLLNGVKPTGGVIGRIFLPLVHPGVLKYFLINNLLDVSTIVEHHRAVYTVPQASGMDVLPIEDSDGSISSVIQSLATQPWPLVKLCVLQVAKRLNPSVYSSSQQAQAEKAASAVGPTEDYHALNKAKSKARYQERQQNKFGTKSKKPPTPPAPLVPSLVPCESLSVLGVPPKLQRHLLHETQLLHLCPSQWSLIPVEADPHQYASLPRPHPLLDHWPIGRGFERCTCGSCGKEGTKLMGIDTPAKPQRSIDPDDLLMEYYIDKMELFSDDSDLEDRVIDSMDFMKGLNCNDDYEDELTEDSDFGGDRDDYVSSDNNDDYVSSDNNDDDDDKVYIESDTKDSVENDDDDGDSAIAAKSARDNVDDEQCEDVDSDSSGESSAAKIETLFNKVGASGLNLRNLMK